MLRITLSGPEESAWAARMELEAAGYALTDLGSNGLPDEGGTAFITVEGVDVDLADECVSHVGWRLRMHAQPVKDAVVMPCVAISETGGQG